LGGFQCGSGWLWGIVKPFSFGIITARQSPNRNNKRVYRLVFIVVHLLFPPQAKDFYGFKSIKKATLKKVAFQLF
jgi:hypothetical protein